MFVERGGFLALATIAIMLLYPTNVYSQPWYSAVNLTDSEGRFSFIKSGEIGSNVWNIITTNGQVVMLAIDYYSLYCNDYPQIQDYCDCAKLEVYDGLVANTSNRLYQCCPGGNYWPRLLTSTSNTMLVVFSGKQGQGVQDRTYFTAVYKSINPSQVNKTCGGQLSGSEGIITSPGFPNNYADLLVCEWVIRATNTSLKIQLLVQDLDLEASSACVYDSLEFIDGTTVPPYPTRHYCGKYTGTDNYIHDALGSSIIIKFVTNWSGTARGFQAKWTTGDTYVQLTKPSGRFFRPQYCNNGLCVWNITVDLGKVVQLSLDYYSSYLDPDWHGVSPCRFSALDVYDGPSANNESLMLSLCYNYAFLPGRLVSSTNNMVIIFRSYTTYFYGYISGTYTSNNASNVCNMFSYNKNGILQSPLYPADYPNNTNCTYTINLYNPGYQIVLNFSDMRLQEATNGACTDFVEIQSSGISNRYCGNSIPPDVIAFDTTTVRFYSDAGITKSGFQLSYRVQMFDCGTSLLTGPQGTITSPGYPRMYPSFITCVWTISVLQNQVINLVFDLFDVGVNWGPQDGNMCLRSSYARIHIFEGNTTGSRTLYGIYCSVVVPVPILSSSNILTVEFKSSNNEVYRTNGFSASYVALSTSSVYRTCGGALTGSSGTINSPYYPQEYPNYSECIWTITGSPGFPIRISFTDFALEDSPVCEKDSLEIRDGPDYQAERLDRLCGAVIPLDVVSTGNVMYARFYTNGNSSLKGFRATWASVCEYSYLPEITYGAIQSPSYPQSYSSSLHCTYAINKNDTYIVQLTLTDLRIGNDNSNCENNYLEVRDGAFEGSPLINGRRYCGSTSSLILTSTQSAMWIRFVTNGSSSNLGFSATFSRISACGKSNLTGNQGYFTSPLYPSNYTLNLQCTWTITTETNRVIQLTFADFLMEGPSGYCPNDYVHVYDGNTLIGIYCDDSDIPTITTTGNVLRVVFKSDPSIAFKGFNASYVTYDPSSECPPYRYGKNCTQICSCSINAKSCDNVNGTCHCDAGWKGLQCEADVNECTTGLHNCTDINSICTNTNGSFLCECLAGYTLTGWNICTVCPQNYYGNNCNERCNCNTITQVCDNVNGICKCKAGWKGMQCELDIDECTSGLHNCTYDHVCTNTDGSYRCDCLDGYFFSNNGSCIECLPYKYGKDCAQNCSCSINTLACDKVNGTCNCKAGWEGLQCSTDINECTTGLHNCTFNNSICVNTNGSYRCDCKAGYTLSGSNVCKEETTTPTTSTPLITTTVTTPKFTTPAATPSPDCNATGGARKLFNLQQLNFDLNSSSTNRLVIDSRLDPSSTGNNPSVKLALYPPDSFLQIQTTDNKTFSVYTTSVMPTVTKNYHFFLEAEVVSGNEIARDFAHLTVNFKRLFPTSPPVRVSFVLDGMRKGGIIYDLSTVLGNVEGLGLTLSSNPNTNLYVFSPNQTSIVCNRDVRLSEFRSNADSIAHQHVLTISTSQGTVLTLHAVIVLNRYSKQIPEDSPIGTLVADFVSLSNDFSVSVVPSAETFVLKSTNVTLGQTLDYENADQRQFKFNVSLALKSDPLLKTEIEANVIVTDVNDAPPEFQKAAYTFITWKGALANSTIGYVEVSDPDSLNGFTYQIDGTENSKYFDILPANGIIVSKVDLKNLSSLVMFNVSVKDGRNWSLRSTKVSISIIQSQNDNLTEIGNSTVVSVQEQMPMHSFVTNASMTNFIGYQLLPDFSAYVAINSSTGIITTTAVLDREDPRMPQIVFSVLAYHKDNLCNFQAISKITIEIIDINDNSPVFTMDGNYSTTLPENSKSGTTVFKVMASDKDKGENAAILFSLESGQSSAPFSIDNQTGVITVYNSSLLDREKNDTIRVVVIAVDGGTTLPSINRKSATATLTINITDMNDNSPAFPQTPYTFNISENLTAPVIVGNVAATDKDIGLNGEIWYLYQGPDSFAINRTSGLIQTTRPLDRELIRNYTLTVYAYDNGSPRLEGSCTVTIIVNDVNDNAPKFKQPYYTANISEAYNCMLSAITNVSADDPDDGLNGQVLYTITNGSLSINNSTGVIMCKASLDYENPSERDIIAQVTATDRGNPPLNASVTVRIRLTDVNDNSPEFIGLTPYNVTLPKQTFEIANATIYAVSARDRDSNENGIVFYTLTSRDPGVADLIWVDTSGVVRVNKTQSFNQGNSYIFDLVASDRGHPPKTNTTFLTLNVVILATSIRFNKSDIIIQIEEGKDPNITTPVVKLDIFDAVPPATFTLANNTVLNVNASSGYLYCISKLDREQQAIYEILATVADERSRSYAMVFVIVSDVNDNAPKFDFSESQMVTDIEENSAIGTFIIAIPAKDPDAGNNSLLTYFLLDPKIPFAVGVSDGRLVVNGTLDRETNQTYKFVLVVKDNGSPSLSSSATVTVGITDVNDNAPTFNTPEILPIPEDADYLTWSAVVKATDPDYGLNGLVKYTVKNMEACPFSVNDGVLKLERNKKLDFETNRSHTCIIQASDSPETGALSTNITVIINVTDVNDNSPIFHDVIGRLNMSRDVEIQYVIVANLNATDADSGINAEIWFDIDASTFAFDLKSYFDINAVSGNITVRKPLLDFPLESVNLTIVAHDRGEPVLSSKVQIEVIISDENTPPKFRQNMYRINITEEDFTVFLDPLITVRADDSENQTLVDTCNCTYVILGASTETRRDVSDYFSIDSSTGTISLTRRNYLIDRENTGNYINVILKVTDKGMPPKSDFATLNVTVWDVNDNAPLFNPDIVGVTITKSKCKSGQVIYQARALDADIYPNNIIGYSLIPFQSPPFTGININETTGELLLTNPNCSNDTIDGTQFWVLISASDNTYNSTLRIYITVNLSDSNPNGPVFLQPLYHASVSSADVEGTTLSIDNFRANDADGDGVTYAFEKHNLTCADDVFWINSVTGKISLQSKLDQFSLKAINLTITAADYGNFSSRFSKTGTTTVFVTVRDYTDKVCIATDKADELQSRADQFNVFRGLFIAIVLLWAITIVVSVALFYKWRVVRYNLRAKQSDTHTFDFPPLHNDADKGSKGKADTTGLPPELPRREGSHGTSSGDSGFRNPAFTIDQDKDGYLAPSEHGTSTGQFSSADSILSNLSLGSSRDTYAGGAAYMPLLPEGPSSFSQPTYLTPSSVIRGKADDPKGTYLHAVPEERGPDTPTYLHATVKPDDIQATFP